MKASGSLLLIAVSACMMSTITVPRQDGVLITLPESDRREIEKYLGRDVVGEPVLAKPIENPSSHLNLKDGVRLNYRFVHGRFRGQERVARLRQLTRSDEGSPRWRFSDGLNQVLYGVQTKDGSLETYSSETLDQGVVSRYSPAEPAFLAGIKPGETVTRRIEVTVFDLAHPDRQKHSGYLNVEYTYVGAYKVTVPAGTYDAALFRWHYKGKVGPAKVEDHQYWFSAPGVGPIAMIQRTDVSAFLVYQDHSKLAAVLIDRQDRP